ncbi:hypothetical protein MLD38_006379 [Melastoma candidum]|uniref:Uncharacterized protein n=1 Tax=Melastoma candidum TaxID=119954 RepID=A0ACB9RME0_9MYRT|nr:hypothetical protein MLD38_006379 [Melastoma candidum]
MSTTPGRSNSSGSHSVPPSVIVAMCSCPTPKNGIGSEEQVVLSLTQGSGSTGDDFLSEDVIAGIQLDDQPEPSIRDAVPDCLQKQRNSASDPVILVNAGGNPWRSGLFDCCRDPISAIITTIAPCVTFGLNTNILDNGSTGCLTGTLLYVFLCPLLCRIGIKYRKRLRNAYQLAEAPVSDRVAHRCFPCCALCQEFRELKYRGFDPLRGYRGLSNEILLEQSRRTIQATPPTIQTMERAIALGPSKSMFTYEDIIRATNGFSTANLLGQGGFGYVYRGFLPNGKEIAVKQLKARNRQGELEFLAEVEIIRRVHHKHLVSLVGYCIHGNHRLLVYEFMPNKDLNFHLHGKSRPTMDWGTRLRIALGSAKGLSYLHDDCHPKIIHRDIKAANILLDYQFEAKVADFGLSKYMCEGHTHISTGVKGTFGYISPEYASSGKLTEKADVFSFGVVLLELITGRKPVLATNTNQDDSLVQWARPKLKRALEDGNFDSIVDPKLQNIYDHGKMSLMVACAAACVHSSANHRPKMSQIVRILEGDAFFPDLTVTWTHSSLFAAVDSSNFITKGTQVEDVGETGVQREQTQEPQLLSQPVSVGEQTTTRDEAGVQDQ